MSDYINRADAIEAVAQQWLFEASVGNPYVNDDDIGEYRKLAEELFEDVPSADAVEVDRTSEWVAVRREEYEDLIADAVQGEWIKKQVFNPELDKYVPLIECSVCGYEPYFGGSESKFNYCANCGARMKGGDTE